MIPAKGSKKITYLLIRRILFACNNRDDNLILHKRFAPLFDRNTIFSLRSYCRSSRIFSSLKMELLLWDIFECIRMNKKFWRHGECIIRRLGVGRLYLTGVRRIIEAGAPRTINKNIHAIVCSYRPSLTLKLSNAEINTQMVSLRRGSFWFFGRLFTEI